ncbi:MAG: TIGR03862 family flavoprotein [Chthoniobacterales bacterium]
MHIIIIGGGPAGLRAAEVAANGGATVTLFDAKASVGRKFLVAGVGGLNLTVEEPAEIFNARYGGKDFPEELWTGILSDFDSTALRTWADGLGVETFAASTGRVYPREMKAAPLLRRWVRRLKDAGVEFVMKHRWTGLRGGTGLQVDFDTGITQEADAVILAMGGGSWPETGSDGGWVTTLERCGVRVNSLQPANCGWEVLWPSGNLPQGEGLPLKNIVARAGNEEAAGELVITKYGLEGGAVYKLGPALRAMDYPVLSIDFKPEMRIEQLIKKMGPIKRNLLSEAARRWKLSPGAITILDQFLDQGAKESIEAFAKGVKACEIPLHQPRPLTEAISSAGGVPWSTVDGNLMLKHLPGVFVAGEMLDWEAPTGGYLLQGCFATGNYAAKCALNWVKENR